MSKLLRGIKRGKKTAYKFRMKLTYHDISLTHDQDYTPSGLVIRWSRGHRQVVSTKAIWTPGTQPNANGQLCGGAAFEPPCIVELLVTLYKEAKSEHFEEKDYKFVLEDEGDRKALGVCSINIGQFADMLGSSSDVTMEMKSLVKKVSEALVAVTVKSEFLKTGKVGDDDMMSTWSAMTDRPDGDIEDDQADLSPDLASHQPLSTSISSEQGASRGLKESLSMYDIKPTESFYEFLMRNARDDVVDSQGSMMSIEHFKDCKIIGLFFAAHSSPQCRFFLTVLDSFYSSLNEVRPRDFEILFVSMDFNDAEMFDFMQESGVAYPGIKSSSQLAEALKEKFDVSSIPEVIAITTKGEMIDQQGRLKIERCGGNEDCFEVLDHWVEGKPAPVRAELDMNTKLSRGLSEDGEKAKIVSKEEKKRLEKLEKERRKKEEEEKRKRDKLEKEEKKRLEREEKKKQRDKEKQDKRSKRSSTATNSVINPVESDITNETDPELAIPDPPQVSASTEENLENEPKTKPTLFQLAGLTADKTDVAEPEPEKSTKKKEKEESTFKSSVKGADNQLREAKSRIGELEQQNNNLTEKNQVLYAAKCQLENEKDDLQERVIELNNNVEDFTEQVRDLTDTKDNLSRENQEKNQLIDTLQDQKLGLTEDLNGARTEVETIRQQLTQSKLKLIEYESDKQAKDEERQQLLATTELQGWLYKRGVRGVTGKKWRRRFFHMGQGFKLYYYKTSAMQLPQGYIDLEKLKDVYPQTPDKQDKNNASFNIAVEGRVFELLCMDVSMRDQWINAVKFLVEYRNKYKVDVRSLSASKEKPKVDEIQIAN